MTFLMLKIYKKNNDKSTTNLNKFFVNFKNFFNTLFLPLTLTTVILFIIGLFLSTTILIPLYLMLLSIAMGFAVIVFILFPIIFLIDKLTGFSTLT